MFKWISSMQILVQTVWSVVCLKGKHLFTLIWNMWSCESYQNIYRKQQNMWFLFLLISIQFFQRRLLFFVWFVLIFLWHGFYNEYKLKTKCLWWCQERFIGMNKLIFLTSWDNIDTQYHETAWDESSWVFVKAVLVLGASG